MKIQRSVYALAAVAALAGSALGMSTAAQARDVAWSIGVASPGLQIGVSNAPQVYRQPVYVPQTVYYGQPQVVYPQPQVTYVQPQVVYAPQPYYVQSVVVPPIYYRDYRRGGPHHWNNGRWDHDRRR